ncbi:hypothetical protein SAMN05443245_5619 [Paraburkholderia fungorum]|uniref:Lysozyme inhibitor LprI N-terminal domain-containing protein n=1 Tax=Paraburkholderia fungorum TaxID=134537 RepID=A0A1H1IT52_9BURK|nr:hypothetical protein [Paraburkholderia fungorum]SDR40809.1 hypothetical protein SAMN05443245_5619 [Paraburkholderia fungorum]
MMVLALVVFQPVYADEIIDDANCMQHLGGGGFGDFDCYEHHAKSLGADSKKVAAAIKATHGITGANRAKLAQYMTAQDQVAKACDLSNKLAFDWNIESSPKTHVDLYDVIGARCQYSLRKQQNDFLHDLYSIKTGN